MPGPATWVTVDVTIDQEPGGVSPGVTFGGVVGTINFVGFVATNLANVIL